MSQNEFASLGFSSDQLLENLISRFGNTPTSLQSQAIPFILRNNYYDLILTAPNVMGKSVAILSSLLDKCIQHKSTKNETSNAHSNRCYAVVIAPSKDIAIQLVKEALKLSEGTDVGILFAINDEGKTIVKSFACSCDILIGTIDILSELIFKKKSINVDDLRYLVIDNIHLLKSSQEKVGEFCEKLSQIQCEFFAIISTDNPEYDFESLALNEPQTITCQSDFSLNSFDHHFFNVTLTRKNKMAKIQYLIIFLDEFAQLYAGKKRFPKTIIFVNDVRTAYFVTICLLKRKYAAYLMTGEHDIDKNKAIYERFNSQELDIIVVTDFNQDEFIFTSELMFNFDLPAGNNDCQKLIERFKKVQMHDANVKAFSLFDCNKNASIAFQLEKFFGSHGNEVPNWIVKSYKTQHRQFIEQMKIVENHVLSLNDTFSV